MLEIHCSFFLASLLSPHKLLLRTRNVHLNVIFPNLITIITSSSSRFSSRAYGSGGRSRRTIFPLQRALEAPRVTRDRHRPPSTLDLRPSPRRGNGTAGGSGTGPRRRPRDAPSRGTDTRQRLASLPGNGRGRRAAVEPRQQAPTDARCAIQTAAAAEQQQQSAVQQHRIVAWGWHRPRAIRRRRGDGAARATRPPRAPRRTRNLTPAPFQVRGRVDPRSASPEAVTRRCVPTAAARAVRAPRLLVTAPPLARAARSSPVLPCTSCAWGSSVATHARRAGAGSRARAAGRGQRVSSCGKLSNPCGRRCSRVASV